MQALKDKKKDIDNAKKSLVIGPCKCHLRVLYNTPKVLNRHFMHLKRILTVCSSHIYVEPRMRKEVEAMWQGNLHSNTTLEAIMHLQASIHWR